MAFGFRLSATTLVEELTSCGGSRTGVDGPNDAPAQMEPCTLRESILRNSTIEVGATDMPRLSMTPGVAMASGNGNGANGGAHDGDGVSATLFLTDRAEAIAVAAHLAIAIVICFVTSDLGLVLDVVGALGSMSISFIVPALLVLFLCKPSETPDEPGWLYPVAMAVVPYGLAVLVMTLVLTFTS